MALCRLLLPLLLLVLCPQGYVASGNGGGELAEFEIAWDRSVLEQGESNLEAAVRTADFLFIDFYAPWCGHCKRLTPAGLESNVEMMEEEKIVWGQHQDPDNDVHDEKSSGH